MASQHSSKAVREGPYTRPFLNTLSAKLGAKYVTSQDHVFPEPYQYCKIKGDRHIRLMVLYPAISFAAPLECDLLDVALDAQRFEALSYVWGSTTDLQPLLCHGRLLRITQNLDGALRFIRRKTRKRLLWVDAICINQNDPVEKETQIPLMRELYTVARHSLIWLGEPDPDALTVLWTMRIMHPLLLFVVAYFRLIIRAGAHHSMEDKIVLRKRSFPSPPSSHEFLRDLLDRDWFARTWTIQELLLNKSALIMCGRHTIPAHMFALDIHRTLPWFVLESTPEEQGYNRVQGQILLGYARKNETITEQVDALQLMMVVRSAAVSNPKDKVIGIQAILQQIGILLPVFSYGMSIVELYTTLTCAWIKYWGNLQILNLAGALAVTPGLPSWVPDWNNLEQADDNVVTDHYTRLVYSQCMDSVTRLNISATRKCLVQMELLFDGKTTGLCLHLQANITSFVVKAHVRPSGVLHHYMQGHESEDDVQQEKTRLWAAEARTAIQWALFLRHCSNNILDTLTCLAGVLNVGPNVLITNEYLRHSLQQDLLNILDLEKHMALEDTLFAKHVMAGSVAKSKLWGALVIRCNTETLYTTVDGRLGLTYTSPILDGDTILLVAGSDYPMLVRSSTTGAKQYTFVGPSILSDLPGTVQQDHFPKWKDRPQGQKWNDYLFKPTLPGDTAAKGSLWNYRANLDLATVSGLMRGDDWQDHTDPASLSEIIVI